MLATSLTAAIHGVDAHLVRVEADTSAGFPKFTMVGLPDSAVRESAGRIRAALRNCGFDFKWDRRITVNMAPASLKKVGSSYDLATAIGLLAADGGLANVPLLDTLFVGELALDGSLRPVPGILPMALAARREGLRRVLVPQANGAEAALVGGIDVHAVSSLLEAVDLAVHPERAAVPAPAEDAKEGVERATGADMAEVCGQALARRALEIAAAGGHNLLLSGPPGSGKTMLARRLPGILPPLTAEEALETTAIHSAWGLRVDRLLRERPFRAPHHTISTAALVGGGAMPRPGEISLAHHGVLFLDELPEFPRAVLESLRQPLEDRTVTVARVRSILRFPARFQLVAAMNPCPCGWRGDRRRPCACTPAQVARYQARISGPLLDRLDLRVVVSALPYSELTSGAAEPSSCVATRVLAARRRQLERAAVPGESANADIPHGRLRAITQPTEGGRTLLARAVDAGLSARAHDRVLRVARTIADLAAADAVDLPHVAEALQYRGDTVATV